MSALRNTVRVLAAASIAAVLLASAVATASASRLSASSQNVRATFNRLEMTGGSIVISCQVTFEGSFHARTMAKVSGALVGAVTRVNIKEESCTGGRARPKNAPWHLEYAGFTGALPSITGILFAISRFRIEIEAPGICTGDYGTETDRAGVTASREAGGAITTLVLSGETRGNLVSGVGLCPASGVGGGGSNVTLLGSSNRISVTLI